MQVSLMRGLMNKLSHFLSLSSCHANILFYFLCSRKDTFYISSTPSPQIEWPLPYKGHLNGILIIINH